MPLAIAPFATECYCLRLDPDRDPKTLRHGYARDITASCVTQVIWGCFDCELPIEEMKYVSYDKARENGVVDIEELPIFKDNTGKNGRCKYRDCKSLCTELHHYGFKRIFNDGDFKEANYFPIGPLCKKHHDYFHEKVGTQ